MIEKSVTCFNFSWQDLHGKVCHLTSVKTLSDQVECRIIITCRNIPGIKQKLQIFRMWFCHLTKKKDRGYIRTKTTWLQLCSAARTLEDYIEEEVDGSKVHKIPSSPREQVLLVANDEVGGDQQKDMCGQLCHVLAVETIKSLKAG
ncbi:hypothetical protein HHI36_001429 [Cryptolaemus montrouzieri]|uniref:Uncharacterized protein n=1 Tax=Cryptolaemus montrouzieri TaxID=559131 RepID=A0ABD2P896_9CUCU